jgi:hypothetical protein
MPGPRQVAILLGEQRLVLTGRVAALVALLILNREEINAMREGTIELHCGAGDDVKSMVRRPLANPLPV